MVQRMQLFSASIEFPKQTPFTLHPTTGFALCVVKASDDKDWAGRQGGGIADHRS